MAMASEKRREPDSLSWRITPETIFRDEVEFHRLEGDDIRIERWDGATDGWIDITHEESLRLTLMRAEEERDDG